MADFPRFSGLLWSPWPHRLRVSRLTPGVVYPNALLPWDAWLTITTHLTTKLGGPARRERASIVPRTGAAVRRPLQLEVNLSVRGADPPGGRSWGFTCRPVRPIRSPAPPLWLV